MAQTVEFVLSADEAQAVRAWQALRNSVGAYQAEFGKLAQAEANVSAEAKKTEAARQRGLALLKSIETEEEKYQRLLDESNDLMWKGALSTKEAYSISKRLLDLKYQSSAAGKAEAQAEAKAAAERAAALKKQNELQAAGKAMIESLRTPMERYRNEVARLNELLKAEAIDEETRNRALRVAREELLKTSGRVEERRRKEAELAAAIKEAQSAEEQRAAVAKRVLDSIMTPQQKYNAQVKELTALRKENRLTEEQYAAALKRSKNEMDASAASASSLSSQLAGTVSNYLGVAAAIGGIKSALTAVSASNERFIKQAEEAGAKYDKLFRQFRIQAGLGALAADDAKEKILNQAEAAGFTSERATSAATALVSAGVSPAEATGGALKGFLATLNTQGLREADPAQFADAITQYLTSQGMGVDTESMKMIGVQLQSLKETKLRLVDLPQLAQIGAGLKGKLTEPEQMATFATLGDALGPNIAATRMADIFKNLSVAGGKEDAVKALKDAKLKPTDVDFHGEDFATVMQRLNTALEKMAPEKQDILLSKVIEGTNVKDFRLIQRNLPLILERSKNLNDVAAYEEAVAVGSSGIDAAKNRQAIRREQILAKRDTRGGLLGEELKLQSLERGEAPVMQDMRESVFNKARYLGVDQNTSASISNFLGALTRMPMYPGLAMRAAGQSTDQATKSVEERLGSSLEQQNVLIKEQLAVQKEQLAAMKNGNNRPDTAPAGPRPQQALDARNARP